MARLPLGTEVRVSSMNRSVGGEKGIIVAYPNDGQMTGYIVRAGGQNYHMHQYSDFRVIPGRVPTND